MEFWSALGVFSLTFFTMELVAWLMHKYIMHGFLWVLHEDHHIKRPGIFEKNDSFFMIFAVPSFFLMLFGANAGYDARFFVGLGILGYGMTYSLMHDIVIHQRVKWFTRSKNWYIRGIRRAHAEHHSTLGKYGSTSFGMLLVHPKYFRRRTQS